MRRAILRRMTVVGPDAHPDAPVDAPEDEPGGSPLPALCPYLASVDGGWRSATVAREHRCAAVAPPAPLAAEKQRRLCLTADHPTCTTYEAARAARPISHERTPALPRPIARTTPVVLDHGRLIVGIPSLRSERITGQAVLVGLLAIAFAAIVLTRLTGSAPGGAVDASPTPHATAVVSAAPASPEPTPRPVTTPAPSGPEVPSPSAGGSAAPATALPSTSSSRTYKVKSGDTLIGIAARFGTTTKAIVALNAIADPSNLRIGQVLRIP